MTGHLTSTYDGCYVGKVCRITLLCPVRTEKSGKTRFPPTILVVIGSKHQLSSPVRNFLEWHWPNWVHPETSGSGMRMQKMFWWFSSLEIIVFLNLFPLLSKADEGDSLKFSHLHILDQLNGGSAVGEISCFLLAVRIWFTLTVVVCEGKAQQPWQSRGAATAWARAEVIISNDFGYTRRTLGRNPKFGLALILKALKGTMQRQFKVCNRWEIPLKRITWLYLLLANYKLQS